MKTRTPAWVGYAIVALGACFYCYEYFLRVAPAVIQQPIMQDFQIDATAFGTLSACYFYVYTPMQLFVGIIVDRIRVRKLLILAIFICALGSFTMAASHYFWLACVGRFLQGFGSAFAFVGALKLAHQWVPSRHFALIAGMVSSLGFLGAAFSEIFISHLIQHYPWRTTIQVFTAMGVILLILFAFTLYFRRQHRIIDRAPKSLHDTLYHLRMIVTKKRIWLAGLYAALTYLPTSVFAALWGVPYMQRFHHYSLKNATLAVSMIFIGWAVGAALSGALSDLFKTRVRIMQINALLATLLAFVILYDAALPFVVVCALFILFGALSAAECLSFVIARDLAKKPQRVGTAVAFINTLTMLGGMLFQSGVGKLLDLQWHGQMAHGIRVYSLHDYETSMIIVPISVGLAFVVSLFIKDTYPQEEPTK